MYLDEISGDYLGTKIPTNYFDTTLGPNYDTIPVLIAISRTEIDTIVEINMNYIAPPSNHFFNHQFKYGNDEFTSTSHYETTLSISNDSVYIWRQVGAGGFVSNSYCGIKIP